MQNYKTLMLGSVATSVLLLGATVTPALADNVEVGHKKGKFYLQTKDGKWSVIPGAQVQINYTFNAREERDSETQFAARRVRFGVAGRAGSKSLTYNISFDISTNSSAAQDGDPGVAIFNSYLNYKFSNALQVRGGVWKQRFTEYHSASSGKTQFVDRNRGTANRLRMDRDTGLGVRGKLFKMLSYEATIINGNSRKEADSNL
ncbi:MAG: porin, partial [Alphaproteobacteria bacterium]